MKTTYLQARVLDEIKLLLKSGDVPIKRISEIAEAVLSLTETSGSDISNGAVLAFLRQHPECSPSLTETMKEEDEQARQATVDEIRMLIIKKRVQ